MGKPTGFMEFERRDRSYKPVGDRLAHYNEFVIELSPSEMTQQAARCMDCGIPFCHTGCPVNNIIPDWNDLVYRDDWKSAVSLLHSTNNFPEFTGRICPAPCEAACTLNIEDTPVTIKTIECAIVDRGWQEGWIVPEVPEHRTDKRVAVVGSGPAGLAASQQLARAGHHVILFEKEDQVGGLLRYGIPDFKLNKKLIDRRMGQMRTEGVKFRCNTNIGVDVSAQSLLEDFDAVVLTGGAEMPRDLPASGRELNGVHFAMDFLRANNKVVQGRPGAEEHLISAAGKHVLVEKPFVETVADAVALVDLADSCDCVLMVSQNYRHFPAPVAAAEIVAGGRFGTLHRVELDFRHNAESTGYRAQRIHGCALFSNERYCTEG